MMQCVYVLEAQYIRDFTVCLKFNTGEAGEADLKDIIYKYKNAETLRDPVNFKNFYLDNWPTLAWDCGFDISPESLYFKVTGKK
jgi:hypothetical protein